MSFDSIVLKRSETECGTVKSPRWSSLVPSLGAKSRSGRRRSLSSASPQFSDVYSAGDEDLRNIKTWDEGLVHQSLLLNKISPRELIGEAKTSALGWIVPATMPGNRLKEGTMHGTSQALLQVFGLIDSRFRTYFDATNMQPSLPQGHLTDLKTKRQLYQWSPGRDSGSDYDKYPPHLSLIPKGSGDDFAQDQLFDKMRLLDSGVIISSVVPDKFKDFAYGDPDGGPTSTVAEVELRNKALRASKLGIYAVPNIGDRSDWFTDEVFAQQYFTGNNPCSIELARDWTAKFKESAQNQKNGKALALMDQTNERDLFVLDFSHLREAIGATPKADLWVKGDTPGADRFACASVCLFKLERSGKLHPVAICIDYKGSVEDSVTIFNRRLQSSEKAKQDADWPWRYAKTCVQASDWIRHECVAHLTETHFIEEAVIVAAYRTLPESHLVYRALHPHWLKTLAINAGARATLVPHVVTEIIGISAEQSYMLLRSSYERFDFTKRYIPQNLKDRGFEPERLDDPQLHNYAYARNIHIMWRVIREYVEGFLRNGDRGFTSDEGVASDKYIQEWCKEMRSDEGGQLKSFPEIKTLAGLIDAVTMCIHIASPQHTAVNYLQEYYQSFVLSKPPALFAPLPTSLERLMAYKEADFVEALPVDHPREWLLASHIPHLLSYRVADDQNLLNYAISQFEFADNSGEDGIRDAAHKFAMDLRDLGDRTDERGGRVKGRFSRISDQLDDKTVEYKVMEPVSTAVSILI